MITSSHVDVTAPVVSIANAANSVSAPTKTELLHRWVSGEYSLEQWCDALNHYYPLPPEKISFARDASGVIVGVVWTRVSAADVLANVSVAAEAA